MSPLKKFYSGLYVKKKTEVYKKEVDQRRNDFIHRYLPFFLDPFQNTRHDVVRNALFSGKRYLDVGCWDGESTAYYRSLEKFDEVYGVDICADAVGDAGKLGIGAEVTDLNHQDLPFPDEHFDAVTCVDVIEHLVEPFHVLREIKRVLKRNGQMLIGTANVASLSNRLRILFGYRPRTSFDDGWDGGHLLYFTPKELEKLLKRYDFQVVRRYTTGNLPTLRRLFYNLCGEFIFECRLLK
jgi:2-polyprenyl-3-methyl-5-hydroxy-6-metoxy-1,4-benzoquinol methylase